MNSYCSANCPAGNIYQYVEDGRKVCAKMQKSYLVGTGVCLFVIAIFTMDITIWWPIF